jgi:hypothetical protein
MGTKYIREGNFASEGCISNLDGSGASHYHLPMIIAATMTIARRRRIIAVWADVCV